MKNALFSESSCFSLYSAQEVNSEDKLWLRVGENAFHFGNANTLIHGTTGAGKSHLLRNLLAELDEKADKDWYLKNVAFCVCSFMACEYKLFLGYGLLHRLIVRKSGNGKRRHNQHKDEDEEKKLRKLFHIYSPFQVNILRV